MELAFCSSRWFTRGWTLQELIAPKHIVFFTHDWEYLRTITDLPSILAKVTGISELALSTSDVKSFSIAQRMSWASRRVTTRSEDIAYCLLGIFDINMPLLYGEGGDKAFLRLQEELLKSSDDQSLFAWGQTIADPGCPQDLARSLLSYEDLVFRSRSNLTQHLLAQSPANFARSARVIPFHRTPGSGSISMTNKGVRLSSLLISHSPIQSREQINHCIVLLDCHFEGNMHGQIGIRLRRWPTIRDQYSRMLADPILLPLKLLPYAVEKTVYVKGPQRTRTIPRQPLFPGPSFEKEAFIVVPEFTRHGEWQLAEIFPSKQWRELEGMFKVNNNDSECAVFSYSLATYISRVPSDDAPYPSLFVVILDYTNFGDGVDITGITIRAGENTSLESLYEKHKALLSNAIEKTKYAIFDKERGRTHVKIDIRKSEMLEKLLCLVDVHIWDTDEEMSTSDKEHEDLSEENSPKENSSKEDLLEEISLEEISFQEEFVRRGFISQNEDSPMRTLIAPPLLRGS
jgi:hypothetical protein